MATRKRFIPFLWLGRISQREARRRLAAISGLPRRLAMNVSDGILRMRFRTGGEKEELMEPGRVYPAEILLYPTSLLVARGHRLRIDVSSSNFPRFDVNPNTGEPLNDNRRWQTAENAVYHDREHASAVLLPMLPP